MHWIMVRSLGRVSLSAAVLAALWCGSAAAQDATPPVKPTPAKKPAAAAVVTDGKQSSPAPADKTPADKMAADKTAADKTAADKKPADKKPADKTAADKTAVDKKPLVPLADPRHAGPVKVEGASFKGVKPGVTTVKEVEKAWGAPKEIRKQNNILTGLYSIESFDHIEVSYFENKVVSVVIRLNRSFAAHVVAEQLALTDVRPVLVSNELGEILGQVYPERGVLFAFEPSEKAGTASMKVGQIILEPISAEPFVLRAETNLDNQYQLSLRDLDEALKLQPGNARAHWLRSRVLVATGEYEKAAAASTRAVRQEPGNPRYRVTRAQILGQVGRLKEAIGEAQQAIGVSQRRPHVKARALCLMGDLMASGPQRDYKQALRYHTEAVKAAGPLATNRHPAIRLAAKEVLVDAHLGAAGDIAWGNWAKKVEAVTRWLDRAGEVAEDLIEHENGTEQHRFNVSTRALAACMGMGGKLDPQRWVKKAVRSGEALIAATEDPLRKSQLQWDLGMALYDTLQIYQMRSEHQTALQYGEQAIGYLEKSGRKTQSTARSYLLGRLYFRLGAIHAIRDKNHRAAMTWFDKAAPLFEGPLPKEALANIGRHGETFISMGVSYWKSGQRQKAIKLTQRGVRLVAQAVEQGSLDESTLAIPYNNLASMYRQIGADEKAKGFEEMAARVKRATPR